MFLVLGAVTVVGPDGQAAALSDRQRSLLASLLARAGVVVSVDNLVDLVWPEGPPQNPVAALHNHVSRLRRAIPFTRIETERWHELRLDEGSPDLPALQAFATEHPLRERAHLVTMRALYACGRQADALAAGRGPVSR